MKAKSAKAKGKRLEQQTAKMLRSSGADDDAKVMPGSGMFAHFKGDIYTKLAWHFECKNQETTKVWDWYAQASSQSGMAKKPVVIFSRNHSQPMALLSADDFINLLAEVENLWYDLKKARPK